jgi:hypothetical protein
LRAKEYIEKNKDSITYLDETTRVINELLPIRNNMKKTEEYYYLKLTADKRYERYTEKLFKSVRNTDDVDCPQFNLQEGEIVRDIASDFREQLFSIVEKDKSFGYIFYFLAGEKNRTPYYSTHPIKCVPDAETITSAIQSYRDDYPQNDIDNWLNDEFNYNFYCHNSTFISNDEDWIKFFNSSYFLFDEIRIRMIKPSQAILWIKAWFGEAYFVYKETIIFFVSELIYNYEFDLTPEQIKQKERIFDLLTKNFDNIRSLRINSDEQLPLENKGEQMTRIIDEKLKDYFKATFKGMGNGAIDYSKLMIEELQVNRSRKELAQIALMIFNSDQKNNRVPSNFSKWYKIFCECVGCKMAKYHKNKLNPIPENLRKIFNYL